MHRRLMLEWVQDCADRAAPMPTIAQIADRFGFAGVEQARTLLADLADAKAIVLTGVGVAMTIHLPGAMARAEVVKTEALPPTIRKSDPAVDRVAAMIASLKSRGGTVPAAPVKKEIPVARKPSEASPSRVDPMLQMLREAGGSVDAMIAALVKRAEDAEARRPVQRPEDAATIEALTKRAEAAEQKLAMLKEMFA